MRKHRNNFVVFYPNVKYLQHFHKLSFSFIFQEVIKIFKSCSRLILNIIVIKQKLTFKEKICHDVVICYITFWAVFCHLSCIILQILTHSLSAYFFKAVNVLICKSTRIFANCVISRYVGGLTKNVHSSVSSARNIFCARD